MEDIFECRHCEEQTHIGGLIGKQTNDCPRCGMQVLFKDENMEDQQPNRASTPKEIVDYYDRHLNITLRELSAMTGRTIANLKRMILR
jgi:DNA-directed RNA polymerase subunit RPC12/RpoP